AHLGHKGSSRLAPLFESIAAPFRRAQAWTSGAFEKGIDTIFVPLLRRAITLRWITLAATVAGVFLSWAYYESGRIQYNFNPVIAGTRVDAEVQTPRGAPFSTTVRVAKHIEAAGVRAAERMGDGNVDTVLKGRMN